MDNIIIPKKKPRTILTKTEEDTAREMMNLALKSI